MANRYLEKIAGILSPVLDAGAGIIRGAVSAGKYAGKELSTALGGGERRYLAKTLGHKDPEVIARMGESFNSFATRRKVLKQRMGAFNVKPGDHADYRQKLNGAVEELRGLQKNKTDAKIISGIALGGAYTAHKKYKENHPSQDEYPATYYNQY